MISPQVPESLAFVGSASHGPLHLALCELQSRYLAQLYKGNVTLPPLEEMEMEIDRHFRWVEKNFYCKMDVSVLEFVPYLDWCAKQIGCDVHSRLTWGLWFR